MERTLTTVVYDEHSVPELGTNITSWSEVLRPPWMLFFVIEAAKVNKQADFEGLRVYGLLTNLNRFALSPTIPYPACSVETTRSSSGRYETVSRQV
jgi:hypothetical protein